MIMDIFTVCDRCGCKVPVVVKKQSNGLDFTAENKIAFVTNCCAVIEKILCEDCFDKTLNFIKFKESEPEKPVDPPAQFESKKKKLDVRMRNYISGITQEQVSWLQQNKTKDIKWLFMNIQRWRIDLIDILKNEYGLETIADVFSCKLPTPDDLMVKGLRCETAYAYRKCLISYGIDPKGKDAPTKKIKEKKKADTTKYYDKKKQVIPSTKVNKIIYTVIDKNVIDHQPTVGRLRSFGLQTLKDCILYQPSMDDLLSMPLFGNLSYYHYCRALVNYGIMYYKYTGEMPDAEEIKEHPEKLKNFKYKVYFDEKSSQYYELIL